jgi:hypothetical protein
MPTTIANVLPDLSARDIEEASSKAPKERCALKNKDWRGNHPQFIVPIY